MVIKGMVQGVFFRAFAKENADKLGIVGFVRNLNDGNVEVIMEGEQGKVDEMVELLKKGPAEANVKDVEIEEERFKSEYQEFDILY